MNIRNMVGAGNTLPGVSIRTGTRVTSSLDGTDFGIIRVGLGDLVTRVFQIENFSETPLLVTGSPRVELLGDAGSNFSVLTQPPGTISGLGSNVFTIQFAAPSGSPSVRTALVSIANDSSGQNPYTFSISGTARANFAPTDLTLDRNVIADGTNGPAAIGRFTGQPDLGSTNLFALVNLGDAYPDNAAFEIVDGNQLRLRAGFTADIDAKPTYSIYVTVTNGDGSFGKAFTIVVVEPASAIGDFLVADRGPFWGAGTVLQLAKDGSIIRTFVTSIRDPYEITTDLEGDFVVANHEHQLDAGTIRADGGIYRISRKTGAVTPVVVGPPTDAEPYKPFITPLGVKVESDGSYIVVDPDAFNFEGAVFRIRNPKTSPQILELTRGGYFDYLQGLAIDRTTGDLYLSNVILPAGSPSQVLKVDPVTGDQTVLASGGFLTYPAGLAVEDDGSAVVVADAYSKKLISIDIQTGNQRVISEGLPSIPGVSQFIQPTHVAIEEDGNYLVTDGKSNAVTRKLFRVDKGTGFVTEIYVNGSFEQPRGVAIAK